MAPTLNTVFHLTNEEFSRLRSFLEEHQWELTEAPYMRFKAQREKISVCAYSSGKLVVQGAGAPEFIEFILEPEILREKMFANASAEEKPAVPFTPHAGMDESGKGDFFGPLVIAAVFVPDEKTAAELLKIGVKDSKMIKNDSTAIEIARGIRRLVGDRMGVVTIGPEAYNRLYVQMHNLNRLLAWGHARALENLLEKAPECAEALADKFADEHLILNALKEKGRKIRLAQRTKAESDVAVAAASIMARAQFVRALRDLGEKNGVKLPKGAGTEVDAVALELFRKGGAELLSQTAKMHFRTAYKAQGLPVPEKQPWTPYLSYQDAKE